MSAAIDLTTLENLRQFLAVKNTGDDELLSSLITRASQLMESACSQSLKSKSIVESFDGSGGFRQFVSASPIISVASVVIDGISIPFAGTSVSAAGYRIGREHIIRNLEQFPVGISNVVISYTAGYATVPADLEQACIHLAAYWYRKNTHIGEVSKSMAGGTTTYDTSDIPADVKLTLNDYTRKYLT